MSIQWLSGHEPGAGACPACGSTTSTRVLRLERPGTEVDGAVLARCRDCTSCYYEHAADFMVDHYAEDAHGIALAHYLQIGAGIDFMLRPVLAVPLPPQASLLEVGCGVGFCVDYWSRVRGAPALGLERAQYGRDGARLLGAPISEAYLGESPELAGRTFDFVYSSEVIEHVPDPAQFVRLLRAAVTPRGLLALTTPSAAYVRPENTPSIVLAALAPGYHYFLLSRDALERLLREAGFRHVAVREVNERLIAWASDEPFTAPDLDRFQRADYYRYLRLLAASPHRDVRSGAQYRLFKELVNAGDYANADAAFDGLRRSGLDDYGLDLTDPPRLSAMRCTNFDEHLRRYPAWLGCALYYAGMLAGNHHGDVRQRLRYFEAATRILRHEIKLSPMFAQEAESLLQTADFHFRQALLYALVDDLGHPLDPGWQQRMSGELRRFAETPAVHAVLQRPPLWRRLAHRAARLKTLALSR